MDFIRCPQAAVKIPAREREAGVGNQKGLKPKIPGHANGRLNGIVGAHSGDDERVHP